MAFEGNSEHLYLLLQTVRAGSCSLWNNLTTHVMVDLRGADLSNLDLSRYDFYQADLRNTNMSNANLREADLQYADLRNANLKGADLTHAQFYKTDLREALCDSSTHIDPRILKTPDYENVLPKSSSVF
jgi:uncharacterized protein YjbI with pentapeptide repeats